MRFHIDSEGGVARCQVVGELDSYAAPAFREAMAALSAFRSAVLDVSQVTFVDSAGLSVIVSGVRRMRGLGFDIVLAAPRPPVDRVLRVAGIDRVVALVPTLEEALALLAHPAAS